MAAKVYVNSTDGLVIDIDIKNATTISYNSNLVIFNDSDNSVIAAFPIQNIIGAVIE